MTVVDTGLITGLITGAGAGAGAVELVTVVATSQRLRTPTIGSRPKKALVQGTAPETRLSTQRSFRP